MSIAKNRTWTHEVIQLLPVAFSSGRREPALQIISSLCRV